MRYRSFRNACLACGVAALASLPTFTPTGVTPTASAQVGPANDTVAGAVALTENIPVTGTTVGAADDYRLSGLSCFTADTFGQSVGQAPSGAPGVDVVYSFTAPRTGAFSFRVTDYTSGNAVLYVATSLPTGTPPQTVGTCSMAANRTANRAEEVFGVSLNEGDQVFVVVDEFTAGGGGEPFTIEVNPFSEEFENSDPSGSGHESQGNDVLFVARSEFLGCPATGVISGAGDLDFLGSPDGTDTSSDTDPNDKWNRVFALVDGAAANDDDFDLRVVDGRSFWGAGHGWPLAINPFHTFEYDDLDNVSLFGASSPNIAGRILPYLGSSSDSFSNAFWIKHKDGGVNSGPYRFYSVVAGDDRVAEREPNNTTAQASTAVSNYFSGTLSGTAPSTDVDFYGFTAQAGDLIFLSLDGDPRYVDGSRVTRDLTPLDARLQLFDSTGATLVTADNTNAVTENLWGQYGADSHSPAEGLVWRARYTGAYFARVSVGAAAAGPPSAGDYILLVSKNCATGGGGLPSLMQFSSASYTAGEGVVNASITVERAGGGAGAVTVDFTTSDGTAEVGTTTPGKDYTGISGTVKFLNGETSKTILIPITGDALDEPNETINLTLSNPTGGEGPGASLGARPTAVLTITDDDAPPDIRINDRAVKEGDRGTSEAVFNITLSAPSGRDIGVECETLFDGSNPERDGINVDVASEGQDYLYTSYLTIIPKGSTTGSFRVPVNGNRRAEPDETFLVRVLRATWATVVDGEARGTIKNDDFPDTIGVYRSSTGQFLLRNSNTTGPPDVTLPYGGGNGDKPVAGDWNGDGVTDVGIYRPALGQFFLRFQTTQLQCGSNGFCTPVTSTATMTVTFGRPGDLPLTGDWNGDGVDTVGVFSNGLFQLANVNSPSPPVAVNLSFGQAGDLPIAGDWNGDGRDTVGIYRNSRVEMTNSTAGGTAPADLVFTYGNPGFLPVVGDWNADGVDTIGAVENQGAFNPGGTTVFLRNSNTTGVSDVTFVFGQTGDLPIAGDWDGAGS